MGEGGYFTATSIRYAPPFCFPCSIFFVFPPVYEYGTANNLFGVLGVRIIRHFENVSENVFVFFCVRCHHDICSCVWRLSTASQACHKYINTIYYHDTTVVAANSEGKKRASSDFAHTLA